MRFRWNRTHPVAPSSEKIRTSTKKQHLRFPVPALHLALRCDKRSRHAFRIAGHIPAPPSMPLRKSTPHDRTKASGICFERISERRRSILSSPCRKGDFFGDAPLNPRTIRTEKGPVCDASDRTRYRFQSSAEQSAFGLGQLQLQPCGSPFVELFQAGEIGGPVDERMLVGRLQAADGVNLVRKSRGEGMRREVHLDVQ